MRFSVIIPTHNRPALLDKCLTAIGSLKYPRTDFEVLVVDDGSDPPPSEIVARHAGILPLRYCRQSRQGPAASRNRALQIARGEYVVFTDDDCEPEADWLNAFDRAFADFPAAGLGGSIVCAPDIGIFGVASQSLITFLYRYAERSGRMSFFCSNNFAFPHRMLLENTGGFDPAFPLAAAEDRDICARWLRRGELHYVAGAVVRHRQELTLISFVRQHYRYGQGAFHFWSRRRSEGLSGNRIAPWSFYLGMLSFPFREAKIPRAIAISALLALSQVASAAGYYSESRKK